jgi:hypothetical protein
LNADRAAQLKASVRRNIVESLLSNIEEMKRTLLYSCALILTLVIVVAAKVVWFGYSFSENQFGTPFCTNPDKNGKPSPGCYAPEYADVSAVFLNPLPVSVCELVKNPMFYDGKNVRIQAMAYAHGSEWYVYDPACDSERTRIGVGFSTPFGSPYDLVDAESIQEPKRAKIVAVGTFSFGLSGTRFQWFFLRRINEVRPSTLSVS